MREDGPAHVGPSNFIWKNTMTNEEGLRTLAHLVGTPYAPALKDTIRTLTGRPRVVGPNEMSTREYDVERIQIRAGADLLIQGFDFN